MAKLNFSNHKVKIREFFKIAITVDCVIFGYDEGVLKVLLIESDLEEYKGKWSLLGDHVNVEEDIDAASYRILKERTGLDDVYLEQVHSFGEITRHPAGRVITVAYYSLIDIKHHQLKIKDHELHWHPVNEIKEMAFDHKQILDTCVATLKRKILDHPVIFNLLPSKFSMRELQNLYEAILGVRFDRRNFRKKFFLKGLLVDVGQFEKDVTHRPGKLYRFDHKKYQRLKKNYFDIAL